MKNINKYNKITLIALFIISINSCNFDKKTNPEQNYVIQSGFVDDLNNSIVEGFFDGDTSNITKETYLIH